ncbi:MAG: hypothetical protein ACD_15C00137G0034 [uncultured bacterium]|nr:MAG: hypothetical protein ACD_15C00137G0034 [uncultured bacterium]HCU70526.1 hypothetical protein [Candidatus Moranbacteria bacterium]
MAKKKYVTRIKKSKTDVPRSLSEANILLGKLGNTQDAINDIEKELERKIAELKEEAKIKLQPLTTVRDVQVNALFTFANPRKAELTQKLRTVRLSSGTFGWRMTPPRVDTKKSDEEVIKFLKSSGYKEFVRIVEEIDRKKLLAKRPSIPDITFVQDDEFFIVPNQKIRKKKTLTHAIDR